MALLLKIGVRCIHPKFWVDFPPLKGGQYGDFFGFVMAPSKSGKVAIKLETALPWASNETEGE